MESEPYPKELTNRGTACTFDTMRRNIDFPGDLWQRVQRAAVLESAKRGVPVSASEWIRDAIEEKLHSTKEHK